MFCFCFSVDLKGCRDMRCDKVKFRNMDLGLGRLRNRTSSLIRGKLRFLAWFSFSWSEISLKFMRYLQFGIKTQRLDHKEKTNQIKNTS